MSGWLYLAGAVALGAGFIGFAWRLRRDSRWAMPTFKYSIAYLFLLFALGLGIIVAYMVLASQFNSLLHPITILTVLPLSVAAEASTIVIEGGTHNPAAPPFDTLPPPIDGRLVSS